MQELADNGEPQEKESWAKDRISLVITALLFVSIKFSSGFFEGTSALCGFLFLLASIHWVILHFLNKNQRFDFKEFFQMTGFYGLTFLIGYNSINLTNSVSASFPDNIIFSKFLSLLIGISTLFLILFIFQLIEKNSKI